MLPTTEALEPRTCAWQQEKTLQREAHTLQPEKPCAVTKTQHSQKQINVKFLKSALGQTSETSQTCSKNLVGPQCRGILEEFKMEDEMDLCPWFLPPPLPGQVCGRKGKMLMGTGCSVRSDTLETPDKFHLFSK